MKTSRRNRQREMNKGIAPVANIIKEVKPSASMRVSHEAVAHMRISPPTAVDKMREALKLPEPAPGVIPSTNFKQQKMAMDDQFSQPAQFAANNAITSAFIEGQGFQGFAFLSELSQRPEYRKPSETFAREMTRKWIKIQATGTEDKSDKIKAIEAEFKRLNVQAVFREAIEQDGFFGRSQSFSDTGLDWENPQDTPEYAMPLEETPAKMPIGGIKRLKVIEPIWTYPFRYNSTNPTDPTFYKPQSWFVMGKEIHHTRLLTIITRELPDILKPAYAFSGLSLSQMMEPYVNNWLRARQSVSDLIHSFTVWTLSTDMSTILNNGAADSFFNRLSIFNLGRDNHGVNAINKDTEVFENISAPLGGLDHLQNQAIEQMCLPASLPLVYMTGITPSGLNASSQGEIEVFHDNCAANQEIYSPHVHKLLNLVQLSLFGEIDKEISFMWEPLKTMSPEQISNMRRLEAETDSIDINSGALTPEERRKRIANEEDSPYAALDLDEVIIPPDNPEDENFMSHLGSGNPKIEE